MENKDQENGSGKTKDDEMICRMSITKEAGEALEKLKDEVNEGFVGGKISRQEIASWAIQKFAVQRTPLDIKDLRLSQMTDQALLRYCVEKTSSEGQMAPDLRQLLLMQCGLLEQPKKSVDKRVKAIVDTDSMREAV